MKRNLLAKAAAAALLALASAGPLHAGAVLHGQDAAQPPADATPPAENGGDDEAKPAPVDFEGGTFTITENSDGEKALAYDGKQVASNYYVAFDRIVKVADTNVALFDVGDGGNQCGPATVIAWKPQGGALQTDWVGEECGAPPAAATADSLYFVPYPSPGGSELAYVWNPKDHLKVAGRLEFAPQPKTGWKDLDASRLDQIVDAFRNEAVYEAARKLLGSRLFDFASGLLTSGGPETSPGGIIFGSGCVPHSCGTADAFMAIDPKGRKLYLAQMSDKGAPDAWPALKSWPADMRAEMQKALGGQQ